MSKLCRGIRVNWTQDTMSMALELLRRGKSQRYVSEKCGILRTTLRNHMKTGLCERRLGRKSILTPEQEED